MKISEFEAKLATVSDAKLMQMLSASRAGGPDVAVQLIVNEGKRRGMTDLETSPETGFDRAPGSGTAAYSHAMAGYADADAPAAPQASAEPFAAPGDIALDPGAPATAPEWLSEETKPGMPVAVKVLMVIVVLGAVLGVAWKFSH
ncbi:MAG: hypothetical protein ABIW76_23525 [Fibrobacteria bacterium]